MEYYIEKAIESELYNNQTWKKLLVYEDDFLSPYKVKSAVKSESFFLAKDGRVNPKSELVETIIELAKANNKTVNKHGQCLFPARFLWIKKQLDVSDEVMPRVACPEYEEWSFRRAQKTLSIVFASGFLGNPASYYGHTLLKVNLKGKSDNRLLDTSVNYGAIVPENENPVSYIVKGLFGGYDAGFSQTEYYFHNQTYGELELRDLWEYELDLESDEVEFILAHAWEVLNKKYTYYFLTKNCSYRMGELFEIIDGVEVNPDIDLWTIPQSQIINLSKSKYRGSLLVKNVKFQPSRQSRLYGRYSLLSNNQKKIISRAIENNNYFQEQYFINQPIKSKYLILDTLIDYYQFADRQSKQGKTAESVGYQTVLKERYKLPPGISTNPEYDAVAPHEGRNPSLVQISFLHNSELGKGYGLTVRPAYYDSLDSGADHIEFSELIMGQFEFAAYGEKIKLRNADLLSIQSLNNKSTGLPQDGHESWRLRAGLYTIDQKCLDDCLVAEFQVDRGYGWNINNDLLLSVLGGIVIRDNKVGSGNLEGRFTASGSMNLSDTLRIKAEQQFRKSVDGKKSDNAAFRIALRKSFDKNWDLRFTYESDDIESYSLQLGHYW